jgi:hypothetical protein
MKPKAGDPLNHVRSEVQEEAHESPFYSNDRGHERAVKPPAKNQFDLELTNFPPPFSWTFAANVIVRVHKLAKLADNTFPHPK